MSNCTVWSEDHKVCLKTAENIIKQTFLSFLTYALHHVYRLSSVYSIGNVIYFLCHCG